MTTPALALPLPLLDHVHDFDAIGTAWRISTGCDLHRDVVERIRTVVDDYDRRWSRFRADSTVSSIAAGGSADFGSQAVPLIDLYRRLTAITDGAMTPLIGRPLEHLGYDPDYRLRPLPGYRPAPSPSVLRRSGTVLTLDEPALIDVGSAGKGQLVDLVAAELDDAGITRFVVDGGRDFVARGSAGRVALEHPYDPSEAIGIIELQDAALCASAANRRSWDSADGRGRLHHVLDGRTGTPVTRIAASWVLASDALLADALSTALFFVSPAALLAHFDFRYVVMTTSGRVQRSPDLPGEVFV